MAYPGFPKPLYDIYSASKAAVAAITEAQAPLLGTYHLI